MPPLKKKNSVSKNSSVAPKRFKPEAKSSSCFSKIATWQAMTIFLLAVLLGNMVGGNFFAPLPKSALSVRSLPTEAAVKMGEGQEFLLHQGQTWLPVEGHPVELIVVNDKSCGISCDPKNAIASLRQGITPALLIRTVDISSQEGRGLIKDLDITGVPHFLLGSELADLTQGGQNFLTKAGEIFTKEGDWYSLNGAKVGLKYGKFLQTPDFQIAGEPTLGKGKVLVVEFTDYQCPFCKRLFDQNEALINRLVAAGKITYVVKDFPLGFHSEAEVIHATGNCVLEDKGNEAYFQYRQTIFAEQANWSGATNAQELAISYAKKAGADTDRLKNCLASPVITAEIKADIEIGSKYGVSGTPALFIGTQVMPGAIGSAAFEAAVNGELSKK